VEEVKEWVGEWIMVEVEVIKVVLEVLLVVVLPNSNKLKGTKYMLEISTQMSLTLFSYKRSSKYTLHASKLRSSVTQLLGNPKDMVSSNLAKKKSLNALFRKCKEKL
tara:strand:+ start:134 stop:454 length:321 start_codon:yes stop_codon:yes gene_type:complete